jgi:hypothetical protein
MGFKEFTATIFIIALVLGGLTTSIYGFTRVFTAQRECIENGYPDSRVYMDGTTYCARKGEMGKDEIVRIK